MPVSFKRVLWIGNVWMLLYAAAAFIFSNERIFLDGSYYFFHVVQSENFHIEHQRFILAVSQLLALAGVKLNLSLQTVLLLNSLNPVVYLWILFLLSVYWLKQEGLARALLLSSVCGIYFIYFIPMYEVWYGCVLLIFFAGVLEAKLYDTPLRRTVFALLLITLLFSYPLIFIGVIYFSVSHFLKERKMSRALMLIYAAAFLVWLFWKYFFISDYETGKIEYPLSQEGTIVEQNFSHAGNLADWILFLFRIYTEETGALLISVFIFFRRKQRWQALWLIGIVTGYLLLIGFFHVQPWKHSNYFERMYLLLIPLSFVPFFLNVRLGTMGKILVDVLVILILCWRGVQIADHAQEYRKHVNEIQELISRAYQTGSSKFMVDFSKHPELVSLDEWSLPMEALIFSSLTNNSRTVTVSWKADIENPLIASRITEQSFRLRLDEVYPDDWLNKKYFRLREGLYQELEW
ncbi:MAG: hypothetical protein K1X63_12190 [Chitinophagales bacterium]|nr:hypothetical protein [Chitinophagales bacterium]